MKATVAELERLVGVIDAKIEAIGDLRVGDDNERWQARRERIAAAFADLERDEGAKIRDRWDGSRLRLAGITATSTSGPIGAMRNWRVAALKRIEKERADGR